MPVSVSFLTSTSGSGSTVASRTFSGVSLGTAATDRLIIVCICSDNAGSGNSCNPSSVTIGGVTATQLSGSQVSSSGTIFDAWIYAAYVPTGTTGDIVVNYVSGAWATAIYVYRATGARITKYNHNNWGSASGVQNATINTITNGCVISCGNFNGSNLSTNNITWTGVTEQAEMQQGNVARRSGSGMNTAPTTQSGASIGATCSGTVALGICTAVSFQEMTTLPISAVSYREVPRVNNILYSEQFNNAAWTKSGSSVVADTEYAPYGGSITADTLMEDSSTGLHRVSQSFSHSAGQVTTSVYVKQGGRTRIRLSAYNATDSDYARADFDVSTGTVVQTLNGSATITNCGNGWYRCSVTGTATATTSSVFITLIQSGSTDSYTGNGASGVWVWGAQNENGATARDYIATTSTAGSVYAQTANLKVNRNLPISATSYSGLLRWNLLRQSEDFNTTWTKTRATVTVNAINAPNGTLTADKIVEDTTATNSHLVSQAPQTTFISGRTYCTSVYAKAGERTKIRMVYATSRFAANCNLYFDLSNGTVTNVGTGVENYGIQDVGNGWYRCWMSATATSDGTTSDRNAIWLIFGSGTTTTWTGDGVSGAYLWGAQIEYGSSPTDYIPTTANQVSAPAETAVLKLNRNLPVSVGAFSATAVSAVLRKSYTPLLASAANYTYTPNNVGLKKGYSLPITKATFQPTAVTNLSLYSETLVSWPKSRCTVVDNVITAPDGALTADKVVEDTTASSTHFISHYIEGNYEAGQQYIDSIYAKAGERTHIQMYASTTIFGGTATTSAAVFDLSTGTLVSTGSNLASAGIQAVGNGWYRCWIVTNAATSTGNTRNGFYMHNGTSYSYTGDGSSGVYVWGAQTERGTVLHKYIPTTTVAVSDYNSYADLRVTRKLPITTSSFIYTPNSSGLMAGRKLTITPASYTYTPKNALFRRGYVSHVTTANVTIQLSNMGTAHFNVPVTVFDLVAPTIRIGTGAGVVVPVVEFEVVSGAGYYKVQIIGTSGEYAPLDHIIDSKELEADAYVDLFEIMLSDKYTKVYLKANNDVDWQGNTYEGTGIQIEGVGTYADDEVARPRLTMFNPEGVFSYLIDQGLLENAKVSRIRVLKYHIDQDLPVYRKQQWYVKRVASVVDNVIGLELRDMMDGQNFMTPGRMFIPPEFPMVSLQ